MDRASVIKSIIGGIIAAPFAYVLKKAFEAWGILDPMAAALGGWLKIYVPPATAGWTLAVLIAGGLYGLLLWKVWRPRNIHHLQSNAATAPAASVSQRAIKAAPHYSGVVLDGYADVDLPPSVTPATIFADLGDKTDLQCEGVVAAYKGQRLTVHGTLYAATRFLGAATTVSMTLDGVDHGSAFMTFEGDRERLSVLRPGDRLSATGRITEATSREIRLVDCRLI